MPRPSVDVVVPFRGTPAELGELRERLGRLHLQPGDTLLVVDNTPHHAPASPGGGVTVIHAAEVSAPGFARNRGASAGSSDWLVFLDADVVPAPDLLDRYFDPAPGAGIGLLAGGMVDEEVPPSAPPAVRYAYLRALMSQDNTHRFGKWNFAQAANVACRRAAFEAVGGFRDDIRAGEDADLCYRLQAAGWEIQRREAAAAVHRNRRTVRAFIGQRLVHGSAIAWLRREYDGSFPPRHLPGLLWWGLRHAARGLASARRSGDRDEAIRALFEPLELIGHEFGRWLPNKRRPPRAKDPS